MRLKNAIHVSTYIREYPMPTLYIADAERDADMKNLSRKEAAKVLEDMKVKIEIPKAAVTQWKRNTALDMAIEALKYSEVPNSSDCISRRAVIDALYDWSEHSMTDAEAWHIRQVIGDIKSMPSAQPEILACGEGELNVPDTNVGDMISRQAAIDCVTYDVEHTIECLKALPSAQPEQVCVATVTLTDEQVKEVAEKAKNAVISVIESEPHWIPCSERLPSETVIATVETKLFKHRYVCEAVWIPRWTRKVLFDEWEDCSEYKEDDDEYYALEGWYERVYNWDEYAYVAIDDNVIAWLPLPEPYRGGEKE